MSAGGTSPRQRFGEGVLALEPSTSVFLNCPFDGLYAELLDALILATVCSGFMPRSALETGTVAQPRMQRILQAMFSSKYSIHDLSRCKGEGDANLARFNMPLELGIAMARGYLGDQTGDGHDWLMLVPENHDYARFISDMAGFDAQRYDGSVENLVPKVMAWLATREDAVRVPTPAQVLSVFPNFRAQVDSLKEAWGGELPWADVVLTAVELSKRL